MNANKRQSFVSTDLIERQSRRHRGTEKSHAKTQRRKGAKEREVKGEREKPVERGLACEAAGRKS